jgi:PAS domain S-box-containing protein
MGFLEQNLITGEMYWSDEVFRLYGVDPAAEPTMELALSLVHPDDREAVSKALQVATEGGEPHDMDHRMMRPDGTVIWVHGQTELVRDSEGNPERLLGTTVDITERRQSEQAILASSPLIALGEMSAAMGHELSQPLTVISAQAEGVELRLKRGMEIDQEQQLTWSTNTQECVERMRALLDHLRLFSQDRSREAKESVSLNDAVHGALFLTEAQLRSRGIELALSLGKDLSPILGDLYRLEQVLVNLISNARNALVEKQEEIARMQGGSAGREDWAMRLDIRTRQEGSELVAEVADNGTGVSGEYRSRIFDPFFTTRAQDRGTGLGLAISHAIVTDHAGVIECESREGGGTLFRVRLPVPA